MKVKHRRILFWSLILLFAVYSIVVDTSGTSADSGNKYLTTEAKHGKLLFQKYNCTACHQLYGLGGYMGPDLTNVISQQGKGAAYVNAFLTAGTVRMPDFHLNETEKQELISFLTYVDKTGYSPAFGAKVNSDGSIILPDAK
ncbi:hypothetical protein BH09BAC5_BH09BAC5_09810 [soil metagenome]